MTTAMMTGAGQRDLVVISGYYGFDNLGDEAILEELTCQLKRLIEPEKILVLSATPLATAKKYGVSSVSRTDGLRFGKALLRARLFISGGGGLFQNTRNLKSVIFYFGQILLARLLGCPVFIFAQGIGPLKGGIARALTRSAFALTNTCSVRDAGSSAILCQWHVPAILTADPVWCLDKSPLPSDIVQATEELHKQYSLLVGVSLRPSPNFQEEHKLALVGALKDTLPPGSCLMLLALQKEQDLPVAVEFERLLRREGLACTVLDSASLERPSQWLSLFGELDMVVSMRLHALIMALAMGVPVAGIAYDPKVDHLLTEFEQPILILADEPCGQDWTRCLKAAFHDARELSSRAMRKAECAKNLACQNFNLLDRILRMQSDS